MAEQEKKFKIRMWHGSTDEIMRVVDLCKRLRQSIVTDLDSKIAAERKALEQKRQGVRYEISRLVQQGTFEDDEAKSRFQRVVDSLAEEAHPERSSYLIERAEERIQGLRVKVYDEIVSGESLEGSPEEVFEVLNARRTKNFEVRIGNFLSGERILVKFSRQGGVDVVVAGSDLTWVNGAIGQLKALLQQRRPAYAWMSHPGFLIPVCVFAGLGVMVQLAALWNLPPTSFLQGIIFWFSAVGLYILWERLLVRRFELYESGGKPILKAAIGGIATLAGIAGIIPLVVDLVAK